ncbi:hypothetical protein K466DRAFT_601434 [Polyporus arcularius HHB13444]|uniref:Uncharacterized protein n=1 Tax=Polyporus arcularius HHB13444 TaxID=1314778 RepID=A0A5C3PGU5_9APHY|nr:hypothetical protein K466DRAFT_601434 [Polyporus arcularius HHB13444]
MDVLAMDVSQDLTVAIEHRHDKEILIHFLTAAAGEPHPLAAKPLLDATGTSASVDSPDAYYHVQSVHISGSNVAWVIPSFISGLDTLQCWNWKTGFLVWERQCDGLAGYTFLDSRFVLTVVHRGQEPLLCIHDLESRADGGDTTAGPVCSLELPRASAGYVEVVHVQSRTTTDSRNAAVPFVRDPMSTAVVLQLAVGRDSEGATSDIIVMIPHRTMYDQIKEAISSSCGTQADRVVEWNMWGLSGAVVLDLPPKAQAAENGGWFVPPDVWPQSFGSRLGLLLCDSPDITSGVVVTVDVHPWAAKCARRYSGHLGHGVYRGGPTASSVDGPSPDVLRRLASMSKMSHALQVGPRIVFPPGQRPSRIITAHDGFAVAFEGDESEVGLRVFTV